MLAGFTERTDPYVPNYLTFRFNRLNECEGKDLALIVTAIALLTIGILA